MIDIYLVLYFIYGILIGSFLNVCIYRIPAEESLISPGSHCTICNTPIKFYDLIPLISFIFLRGKCRNCKTKIGYIYPAIELLTGVLYILAYINFGFGIQSILVSIFFSALVVIFFIDLHHMVIPDSMNIIIALTGIAYILLNRDQLLSCMIGAFIVSVPIWIISVLTKGFGFGDVLLFAAAGLFLGAKLIALTAFLAIVLGGLFSSFLVISKIREIKSQIPFGPFIVIGLIISSLYGKNILLWYESLFNL